MRILKKLQPVGVIYSSLGFKKVMVLVSLYSNRGSNIFLRLPDFVKDLLRYLFHNRIVNFVYFLVRLAVIQ